MTYTYDANGSMERETTIDYVKLMQSETVIDRANKEVTYSFSVKGELKSTLVATPKASGEPLTISTSYVKTTNSYDTEGQRVVKEEGDETMRYYYSGGAVLYTVDSSEVMRTENVLDLSGTVISSKRFEYTTENDPYANGVFNYRYDLRGSVTNIVNAGGTVVKGYNYDEYGNAEFTGDEEFLNENTFAGAVADQSSGLMCMGSRFYSPTTGRFISQDTYSGSFFEPWTQHLYAYCNNNPASMIDPTGHAPVDFDEDYYHWNTGYGESTDPAANAAIQEEVENNHTEAQSRRPGPASYLSEQFWTIYANKYYDKLNCYGSSTLMNPLDNLIGGLRSPALIIPGIYVGRGKEFDNVIANENKSDAERARVIEELMFADAAKRGYVY